MPQSTSAPRHTGGLPGGGAQFGSADGRGDDSGAKPSPITSYRKIVRLQAGACVLRDARGGAEVRIHKLNKHGLQRPSFRHTGDLQQRPIYQALPRIGSGTEVLESGGRRHRQCLHGRYGGSSGAVRDRCRIYYNDENIGFAAAQNQAIGLSGGDWVLTLNPDVLLLPNFIQALVEAGQVDP